MGAGVRVALPTRMLDGCASLGDVLSKRTWLEVLDADDRASLRAHLPRGFADDEIPALLDRLFHPEASDAGYFHAGNPAERAWREMRARERTWSGAQGSHRHRRPRHTPARCDCTTTESRAPRSAPSASSTKHRTTRPSRNAPRRGDAETARTPRT